MKIKFKDAVQIISGGTPKTSVPEYWNGDIGWLSVVDFVNNNKYVETTEKKITQEGLENSSTKLLATNDIIISARGTVGAMAMLKRPLAFNQSCFGLRANSKLLNQDYLFYYLKNYMKILKVKKQGSVFDTINLSTFDFINLDLPTIDNQEKVASILSDIDNKIELNNKIISELESIAKTIYNYWFLQFEFPNENGKPYKSSGGKMVWNEELKREIPEGWSIKKLSDVVEVIDNRGKNPPTASSNTRFPIIDVATLRKRGRCISYIDIKNYVTEDVYKTWFRAGHPQKGDILFSTVGSLAETKLFYPNRCYDGVIAQNIVGFRNKEIYSYLYQMINSEKKQIIGYKIGSVQPSLKVGHVLEHKFLYPNNNILNKYCDMLEPINGYINKLNQENHELETLRDFLLPMLMNGQVTFKEDE